MALKNIRQSLPDTGTSDRPATLANLAQFSNGALPRATQHGSAWRSYVAGGEDAIKAVREIIGR